jgi:integrase
VVNVSLGVTEVDAYLKFLRYRCRLNTWISYGYDLQIFLNFIEKPLIAVTPADILAFIESQQGASNRQGRTDGLSMQGPGLSNRTIKRRLAAVAGFYEYLRVFHDFPLQNNPVPRGLTKRSIFWSNRYSNAAVTPLIRAPETLPRPLNPEEIGPFVDSLRNHRDKAMVLLMLLAGLRKSEVLKLILKDIDFETCRLLRPGISCHERATQGPAIDCSGPGYHHRVPSGKGKHSRCPVPSSAPHLFHPAAPGRYVTGGSTGSSRAP